MYLLLFVIAAISTAVANPVPADEAHREKLLAFSFDKDNSPSAFSEPADRDDSVRESTYGRILNKHQIPSGVTSEYPVGDMHLPLQIPKTLDPAILSALEETELHIPKLDHMDQGSWSLGSWFPWKRPSVGAQPDSKCGKSKSVCCMQSFTRSTSVVNSCNQGNLHPSRASYILQLADIVCGQKSLEKNIIGNGLARPRNTSTLAINFGTSSMTGIPLW
ncbi:hypothetical protein MMC07_004109 [Pseudocyphellaria aurata]|nr:hypothetical protein [Pseudocyphellaria aurata]